MQVVGYGHLGDGNLHLNISTRKLDRAIEERLEPFVYEWTSERRGSISAEHGLGQMKADCIGCARMLPIAPWPLFRVWTSLPGQGIWTGVQAALSSFKKRRLACQHACVCAVDCWSLLWACEV